MARRYDPTNDVIRYELWAAPSWSEQATSANSRRATQSMDMPPSTTWMDPVA